MNCKWKGYTRSFLSVGLTSFTSSVIIRVIMEPKLKIYLDTSIPSALYDYSKPIRQIITQKWFENDANDYLLFTSTLTLNEIEEMKNIDKRQLILDLIKDSKVSILDIDQPSQDLANIYHKNGAIPKSEPEDALHVAIAVVNNIQILASWNFKHLVSVNPILKINEVNRQKKLSSIEIVSLEQLGGYKYGNL